VPEVGHPHYRPFRELQIASIRSDYTEQKAALDELHQKSGTPIFVANYMLADNQYTGEIVSYCSWSASLVSFLPKTDYIAFGRVRDPKTVEIMAHAPWFHVEAVLGDRIRPVGIYPERYRVEQFPTEDEIGTLGFHY
jgi:hypothetical protein